MNVSEFRKKLMDKFNQRIEESRARDARQYDLEDARLQELSEMIDDEFMELIVEKGTDRYSLIDECVYDQLHKEKKDKRESLVGPPSVEEPSQDQESNDQ